MQLVVLQRLAVQILLVLIDNSYIIDQQWLLMIMIIEISDFTFALAMVTSTLLIILALLEVFVRMRLVEEEWCFARYFVYAAYHHFI